MNTIDGMQDRTEEVALLAARIDRAAGGVGQIVAIEGEAGIGKSLLIRHALLIATSRGFLTLRGRSPEPELATPFQALHEALRDRGETARGSTQTASINAFGDEIEQLAHRSPVVLAIDDLHWADDGTLRVVWALAQRLASLPVLLLLAARPEYPPLAARLVDRLLRDGATHVALSPLSMEGVRNLVTERLNASPSPELLALAARAGGNPLLLIEFLDGLIEEGSINIQAGRATLVRSDPGPLRFRQSVRRRLQFLSSDSRDLLLQAAVLGSAFNPNDLALLVGCPPFVLLSRLEEVMRAGIIAADETSLAFRHPLVRDAIYEAIPVALRRQLHRAAGERLAEASVTAARVAAQFALGAELGDERAVAWLRRAADEALETAPELSIRLLERARSIAIAPRASAEVHVQLALASVAAGRLAEVEEDLRSLMSDRSVPQRAIEVDAALTHALTWHGRPREALELPIALASRSRDGSRLHAFRLVAAAFAGEIQSLEERTKSFLANTRQDRVARCAALGALAWAQMFSGECLAAVDTGTEAVTLGRRLDPRGRQQAQPWFFSALTLIFTDQLDRASTIIDEGWRAAESTGTSWPLPLYHSELANIHWLRGSWDDAVAEDEAAQAIADEYDLQVGVLTGALSRLARILVHRGETDEARKLLERSDGGSRQTGSALLAGARALVHEATGDLAAAEQTLASAWDENIQAGVLAEIRLLAPDLVRLHLANGHRGDAGPIVSEAYRMAKRMSVASAEGAALRCAGLLDDSPDLLLRASAAYGRSPRVFDHALALEETALSLARSRHHADALDLASRADATYKQLGAYYDRLRLNGALRAIGLPPTAKRLRARATRGWESLTDSELRVVKLVAGGATNKEVAGSLLISRHTVDSHLRHAYAKLDVVSRVQLAVLAMRQSQQR